MTHYWESSERPLFVKTVYVNGNRHAILSQEDPLVHSGNSIHRKHIRSNSSLSFVSNFSSNSSESQESNSEVRIKISKARFRRTNSRDISKELQRCLVKLRFPTTVRDKEPEGYERDTYNSQEENESLYSDKQRLKNWNESKIGKKINEKQEYHESAKSNTGSDYGTDRNNSHGSSNSELRKFYIMKVNSNPSELILNCSCEKNWCNIHGFLNLKQSLDVKKRPNSYGDTAQNAPSDTKKKPTEKQPIDSYGALFGPTPCELYWNNYLNGSLNTSLTERVIQWIDLASKQKKCGETLQISQDESGPGQKHSAKFSNVGNQNKTQPRFNFQNGKTDSKLPLGHGRDNLGRKSSPDDDAEVDRKVGTDSSVISFVGQIQNENPDRLQDLPDKAIQLHKSQTFADHRTSKNEDKPNCTDDSVTSSISPKIKSNPLNAIKPRESVVNQQSECPCPMKGKPTSAVKNSQKLNFEPFNRKKIVRQESSATEGDEKEFKTRSIRVFKKKGTDLRNQRNQSARTNEVLNDTLKLFRKKSAIESERTTKHQEWLDEVSDKRNVTAMEKANVTRNILNRTFILPHKQSQNHVFCLRESRTAWENDGSLEKPQLHIFIPSLPQKEVSDESLSECEGFLNEMC